MERATQERLVGATLLIVAGVILIPWLLDGSMTEPGVNQQELVLPGGHDSGNETRRISLEVPQQNVPGSAGSGAANSGSTASKPANSASSPFASTQAESAGAKQILEVDARSVKSFDQPPTVKLPKPEARQASTTEAPARFAKPMPRSELPKPQPTSGAGATARLPPASAQPTPKPVVREVASTAPVVKVAKPTVKPSAVTNAPAQDAKSAWAVQVGSFASEENAERLAARLRDKSYKAFVMRNVIDGLVRFRVRVGPVSERNQAELLATALREDRQPARILSHP